MDGDPGNQGNPQGGAGDPAAAAAAAAAGGGSAPAPMTINADILGEYKDDPVFKAFEGKGLGEVFKSYKNAQSMIGGEKLTIPAGKLDNEETWNYVFGKLGRPETADGYKLDVKELPAGGKYDEKLLGEFKAACHQLGMLPKQAQGAFDFFHNLVAGGVADSEAAQAKLAEETESTLMKELGTKAKYDEFVGGAKAAMKRFGGEPAQVEAFIEKFGNDPVAVRMFGNVAKAMLEDAALRGDTSFKLMGEDAQSQLKDIQSNPNNRLHKAYYTASDPNHQAAVDEVYRLNTLIHGVKPINMAG